VQGAPASRTHVDRSAASASDEILDPPPERSPRARLVEEQLVEVARVLDGPAPAGAVLRAGRGAWRASVRGKEAHMVLGESTLREQVRRRDERASGQARPLVDDRGASAAA